MLVQALLIVFFALSAIAGEPDCVDGVCKYVTTNKFAVFENSGDGIIAECDRDLTNCKIFKPEAFPCYQKMQEAMRAMDQRISHFDGFVEGCPRDHYCEKIEQRFVEGTKLSRLWGQTMKECVVK